MTQPKILITPSILSADLSRLQEEVDSIEAYADWLQVDVMDGHFVPNLSFGAPILKNLKTKLPLDIHLMVENPADRIDEFVAVGAKHITFHCEAVPDSADQKSLIEKIHSCGCTAGIALNPETPLNVIEKLLSTRSSQLQASPRARASEPRASSKLPDLILLMTVHPGFSGQRFEEGVLPKIRSLREEHPDLMIQVDGGINAETAKLCRDAGANNLVAASFIFGSRDRKGAIEGLRGEG